MHDAQVSANMVDYIIRHIEIFAVYVDQGLPILVWPITKKTPRRAAKIISLHQPSEWWMRGLQGTFPRPKSRLT